MKRGVSSPDVTPNGDWIALQRDLEDARFIAANLQHELQRLTREQRLAVRHIRNLSHQLEILRASKTLRLTAPLRAVSGALRRGGRWMQGDAVCCDVQPAHGILDGDTEWPMRAVTNDPWLKIDTHGARLNTDCVRLQFRMEAEADYMLEPRVGWGRPDDTRASIVEPLRIDAYGYVDAIVAVPPGMASVWLQPCCYEGAFSVADVRVLRLSRWQARLLTAMRELSQRFERRGAAGEDARTYRRWIAEFDTLTDADRTAIAARIAQLRHTPLISIVMPVYDPDVRWLRRAIDSVRQQLYPHWELCIADDCSTARDVRDTIERYRAADPRIKVQYRSSHGHIAACSQTAVDLARGEFIALMDHDDEIREHALYLVAEELNDHPDAAIVYTDEDKIDHNGQRYDPYFKSDWNVDLFYSHNLISHLGVYRRALVHEVGGFRQGLDGSQDYDLALRCIERIPPAHVRHIPFVLYHWRSIASSVAGGAARKGYAYAAARRALGDHFDRRGVPVEVTEAHPGSPLHRVRYKLPPEAPLVSIVMPTRDNGELLRRSVGGILARTEYAPFELIVVDNDSADDGVRRYLAEIAAADPRVRVVPFHGPFNFSAINNAALGQARGEIIAFVNNDVDVITSGWLREMVSHAVRPDIGVVGAMLYYANNTIQHAGIVLGIGGVAGHLHKYLARGTDGYVGRARLVQNLSAVTAACCVMRRAVLDEVNGFDETLAVAFNDVDLCLRIEAAGYRNLWTPYAELYHFESATRGFDLTGERAARFTREANEMKRRYGNRLMCDRAYSPNLTLEAEDLAAAFPPRTRKPWRIQ